MKFPRHGESSIIVALFTDASFSKKMSPSYPDTPLYISDNCPLLKVEEFKYLGVTLTSDLNWANHIATICNKAKKLIGMFYRKLYSFPAAEKLH